MKVVDNRFSRSVELKDLCDVVSEYFGLLNEACVRVSLKRAYTKENGSAPTEEILNALVDYVYRYAVESDVKLISTENEYLMTAEAAEYCIVRRLEFEPEDIRGVFECNFKVEIQNGTKELVSVSAKIKGMSVPDVKYKLNRIYASHIKWSAGYSIIENEGE